MLTTTAVAWAAFAVATAVIAAAKGRSPVAWLALGLAFGVFATLYVAFAPRAEPPAPAAPQPRSDPHYTSALERMKPLGPIPGD